MSATNLEEYWPALQHWITYAWRVYMTENGQVPSDVGLIMNRENGPSGPPGQSPIYAVNWDLACSREFAGIFPRTATFNLKHLEMAVLPILQLMYAGLDMPALTDLTFHFRDKHGMRGGQSEYQYDSSQAQGRRLGARSLQTVRVGLKNTTNRTVAANMVAWVCSVNGLTMALTSGVNLNATRRLGDIVVYGWKYVPNVTHSFGAIHQKLVDIAVTVNYSQHEL